MVRRSRSGARVQAVLLGSIVVLAAGCGGGGGGGGGTPTNPPPPMLDPGSASFRLVGGGQDGAVSYSNGSNLVFCSRDDGFADLFLRFAEQAAANGENGPHLDVDLCNHEDGGVFAPHDTQVPSCGDGPSWGVFWHGADGTFVNRPNAPSCTLDLTRDGAMLSGTFRCRDMRELGGNRTVDLLDGSFQCVES